MHLARVFVLVALGVSPASGNAEEGLGPIDRSFVRAFLSRPAALPLAGGSIDVRRSAAP